MAIIRYSGNRLVATGGESKPTTDYGAFEEGTTFHDIDNDALWQWNGSAWEQLLFASSSAASESFAIAMAVAL